MNTGVRYAFIAGASAVLTELLAQHLITPYEGEKVDIAELFDQWAKRQVDETELIELSESGARIRHPWAVQALAESFFNFLVDVEAENYVEQEVQFVHVDDESQRHSIIVTVRRAEGKTPAQRIAELEAELEELKGGKS
jgi:3-methyladenine DNA glycosylase AlkC